ncbi:MAG TPA: alpha/beta fold hydrolase [Terriglobales bacterium]|jgi:pimeloyl-ACP methyl ester carboxylesterase
MITADERPERLGRLDAWRVAPMGVPLGPPLLLVHGLGGGPWGWENFQRRFAENGYLSYAVELPGHGSDVNSPRAGELGAFSIETYALYLASALAELGQCVVIGHSMGGLIAQKLAESHDQAGYVFLCSAPPWHMFRRAYWAMWRRLLWHPWRQIVAPVIGRTVLLDDSLQDELVNNRLSPEARAIVGGKDVPDSGRASMQMVVGLVTIDASQVRSPCLVVGSTDDRLIPPSEQRLIAKKYACPLQLYDRGHMLLLEDGWEEIADGILSWVAALPAARADMAASI